MPGKRNGQLCVVLVVAAIGMVLTVVPTRAWYATATANDFKVHHWDPWYEPHYGAYFAGSYVSSITFLGSGGNTATCGSSAGCIANWNWLDNNSVLLVPKGNWLLAQVPWIGDRWKAYNYQAEIWIN